jgi:hypothetical protein
VIQPCFWATNIIKASLEKVNTSHVKVCKSPSIFKSSNMYSKQELPRREMHSKSTLQNSRQEANTSRTESRGKPGLIPYTLETVFILTIESQKRHTMNGFASGEPKKEVLPPCARANSSSCQSPSSIQIAIKPKSLLTDTIV